MPYESTFSFDSILVAESLDKNSLQTGTELFETTLAPAGFRQNLYSELYKVSSRGEFFGVLNRLKQMSLDGRSPILHLEMHGDTDGLQVTNGEIIGWSELVPALSAINEKTRMNLLVVAAACHGWHLSEILKPIDRAPAWGIIGPQESIVDRDLYEAMKRFYGTLLTSLNLRTALDAANAGALIDDWIFRLQSADLLYCNVFRRYLTSMEIEETQAQRVNRLVADIASSDRLDVIQTMKLRAEIRERVDDHQFWYDHYKKRFLMLDLFPENADRFQLALNDCLPRG